MQGEMKSCFLRIIGNFGFKRIKNDIFICLQDISCRNMGNDTGLQMGGRCDMLKLTHPMKRHMNIGITQK